MKIKVLAILILVLRPAHLRVLEIIEFDYEGDIRIRSEHPDPGAQFVVEIPREYISQDFNWGRYLKSNAKSTILTKEKACYDNKGRDCEAQCQQEKGVKYGQCFAFDKPRCVCW